MSSSGATALGIDVGGARKGYDLVLLNDALQVLEVMKSRNRTGLADLIRERQPDVIAIDSPPAWATGKERETETFIRGLGINLYQTPWIVAKQTHPFYAWMINGFEAFKAALDNGYRRFDGGASVDGFCMEVFPYASAVVLSEALRPAGMAMRDWRRAVLSEAGVASSVLRNSDQIDAALAALTGIRALLGHFTWSGDPQEGVIVLPCLDGQLPTSYRQGTPRDPGSPPPTSLADKHVHYPDRSVRRLTNREKAEIRSRLGSGDVSSYVLAQEFGCATVQIAGIKAAMTLSLGGRPDEKT